MSVILWLWFGLILLTVLVWLSRHLQLNRAGATMPPLRADQYPEALSAPPPRISMLVAAKDEEANIEGCLQSLLRQDYPNLQLIAVNDRSSDRTGEIIDRLAAAGNGRLAAVHVCQLRPGWFGKNNAMREGLDRADGEWLCFTDADCVFDSPRTLTVAMRWAIERQADFISVLPTHQTNSFWERVFQPACSGILLIWFNPLKVNDPGDPAAYANGAFMLMRRSCYEAIGGHEVVKTEVNEDIHLARLAKSAGRRLAVVTNQDLYAVRMYTSLPQIWAGWTRIFYGCFGSARRLLLSAFFVGTFGLLSWITLAVSAAFMAASTGVSTAWHALLVASAASALAQMTVMLRFYARSQSGALYGLLYPLGAVFGLAALLNAIRRIGGRRTVTWRGTTYRGHQVSSTAERTTQ